MTCATCYWWFRLEPSEKRGHCVLLTGLTNYPEQAPLLAGKKPLITTLPDFGCNRWEESRKAPPGENS